MPDFVEPLINILLPVFAIIGSAVLITGLLNYRIQLGLKRVDRLMFSMKNGLNYLRDLHQKDSKGSYPKLYKKLRQEGKELELLLDKYGHKLESSHYQEAQRLIHVASVLEPKSNFLTEMAGGVLDVVDDFFPEVGKVTSLFKRQTGGQMDIIYDFDSDHQDPNLAKVHYVQQVAPEILEIYTKIEKSNEQIVQKLETNNPSNKAELLAIHQANMRNFEDVLKGYLSIKEDPSYYYKAQERLTQARETLVRVDQILTETLRQLNENDMMNFEISLRLLQKES